MTLALLIALVTHAPDAGLPQCSTVADCWLDAEGHAISRPRAWRGKPVPRGDCGKRLLWLRYQLRCDAGVCTSTFVADKC